MEPQKKKKTITILIFGWAHTNTYAYMKKKTLGGFFPFLLPFALLHSKWLKEKSIFPWITNQQRFFFYHIIGTKWKEE